MDVKIAGEVVVCESCAMGKHHRYPFKKYSRSWRAKDTLELIGIYFRGQMQTPSLNKISIFLSLLMIFLGWHGFISWRKNQKLFLYSKYLKLLWKSKVVNQSKCSEVIHAENTLQLNFKNFSEDEGIWKQLTTCYSPQPNGVAEWKNLTIVEIARLMIHEKNNKVQELPFVI